MLRVLDSRAEGEAMIGELLELSRKNEALEARVKDLEKQLERLETNGVHTCHDECPRIACVQYRENARLSERVASMQSLLGEIANCTDPSELSDAEAKETWDSIFYRVNEFFRKHARQEQKPFAADRWYKEMAEKEGDYEISAGIEPALKQTVQVLVASCPQHQRHKFGCMGCWKRQSETFHSFESTQANHSETPNSSTAAKSAQDGGSTVSNPGGSNCQAEAAPASIQDSDGFARRIGEELLRRPSDDSRSTESGDPASSPVSSSDQANQ